ncbi:hypothetical protein QQ045_000199 [Rhodiola kirilowii]
MSLLTRLPAEGEPMTGKSQLNFDEVCVRLLGVYPECKAPGMAKRSWFTNHLALILVDADDETLKKYARAYLLNLIGSTLFSDKSGKTIPLYFLPLLEDLDRVRNYSWGSVVLACLYSNMCGACTIRHSQLADAPLIIQFWAWDRLSRIDAPKITVPVVLSPADAEFKPALHGAWSYLKWVGPKRWVGVPHGSLLQYRDAIQKMQPGDFIWRPYDYTLFELLNPICLEGQQTTWRADVPLICYNIIEWHLPARVARYYIALWVTRQERLLDGDMGDPYVNIDKPTAQYVTWYSRHTYRLYQLRIDDDVEEVGDENVQETRHSYRPDSHMIPDNIRGYVIGVHDAGSYFLNNTDDYSHRGFHVYSTISDLDIGGEEDIDTHVEDTTVISTDLLALHSKKCAESSANVDHLDILLCVI